MRHELGIRARAQLIQIHTLLLTLHSHALRHETIQRPVHSISQRQHETQQRPNANNLRQNLSVGACFQSSKQAHRQNAPKPGHRMNRDPAPLRVVDLKRRRSSSSTEIVTCATAINPTIKIAAGGTNAHAALPAAKPPTQPLAVSDASGLPKRIFVIIAATKAADDAPSNV